MTRHQAAQVSKENCLTFRALCGPRMLGQRVSRPFPARSGCRRRSVWMRQCDTLQTRRAGDGQMRELYQWVEAAEHSLLERVGTICSLPVPFPEMVLGNAGGGGGPRNFDPPPQNPRAILGLLNIARLCGSARSLGEGTQQGWGGLPGGRRDATEADWVGLKKDEGEARRVLQIGEGEPWCHSQGKR